MSSTKKSEPSTTVRAGKYTFVGIILTIFNFGLYTIIARLMGNNDFLWLDTLISTAATTILAYILHSRITWKERDPGKSGILFIHQRSSESGTPADGKCTAAGSEWSAELKQ